MRNILLTGILLLPFFVLQAQVLDPVTWQWEAEKYEVEVGEEIDLSFDIVMEPNWYVYATGFDPDCGPNLATFDFEENDTYELVGDIVLVGSERKYDEIFECDVVVFKGEGTFVQRVKVLSKQPVIKGVYEFQTCNEVTGVCLPPKEGDFDFIEFGGADQSSVFNADAGGVIENNTSTIPDYEMEDFENPADASLWAFLISAILLGFAAVLTPCVFPMVPMTVTFFMKDNDGGERKGIRNGLIFGLSIIGIYTFLGTIFALVFGADSLNGLATHWFPNLFAFAVFVIFALSFLGMFEITLPSGIVNRMDKQSDRGGYIGIFFMAFTLALVSFSCTFPLVGTVLTLAAQGSFTKPIVGMVGFSLALALPFTLFAIFPQWLKSLPKSGGWLNSVKVMLGFLELALGLKFLSVADLSYHWGILDREIYLAAWIVIGTLMGFYILGKIKLPHDSPLQSISVPRIVIAIVIFSFVVYLIPGMFGAPLKGLSGYLPPMHTMDGFMGQSYKTDNKISDLCEDPKYDDILHFPPGLGLTGYFDLDQALDCAKTINKPIFIDFTGHGCVNCRKMEEYVWADPNVLNLLKEEFILAALYIDDKTVLPESEWYESEVDGRVKKTIGKQNADYQIRRFNNNAQPFYIILGPDGKFVHGPQQYDTDINNFVDFLKEGVTKFETKYSVR